MNRIKSYYVSIPGRHAVSTHDDERAATRAACKMTAVTGRRYRVYATHVNGDITGPYDQV